MSREQAYAALDALYQQYLGRKGSPEEYETHLVGDYSQASLDRATGVILRSGEAGEFKNKPAPNVSTGDPFQTRPEAGDFSRMEGYDPRNWGSMNSMKYRIGEILARYPPTPEGLMQAMADPDMKKIAPNAKLVGHDTIDFGGQLSDFDRGVGVGKVDVGRAFDKANNTGGAWVWQDLTNTGGSKGGASAAWKPMSSMLTPPPAPNPTQPPAPPNIQGPPGSPDASMSMADFAQQGLGQPIGNPDDLYMSELARARRNRIGVMA